MDEPWFGPCCSISSSQDAFYVVATPKLRQADASPRQATFFHFRTLQTLRQLKKTTQRRQVERESSTFRNQLPFVQACSSVLSFSLSFRCLSFTTF